MITPSRLDSLSAIIAMSTVFTYLFEKKPLLREGLKSLLADSRFEVMGEYGHIGEVGIPQLSDAPQLLIIGTGRQHDLSSEESHYAAFGEQIERVRRFFSSPRVVVLLPQQELLSTPELFCCRADGYIPSDISADALISYLTLTMIGESVISMPAALNMVDKGERRVGFSESASKDFHLSERESDIIRCLVQGQSNKLIARALGITESTVKVHLKTILRKLGVSNRTQAALWAVQHGFAPTVELPQQKEHIADVA